MPALPPQMSAALVTGAAQRIGQAIARDLARNGWPVAIHCHGSEAAAHALRDEIRGDGGRAEVLSADLSKVEQAASLVLRAAERLGPIGLLINNASAFEADDLSSVNEETWATHIDLNLRAPLLLCQDFAARLPRDQDGIIINMLDGRVLNPTPRALSYTLSKTGLWTLTRMLAQSLAPKVRVNGIGPGPTLPPRGQSQEDFEARCARLPLQRPATLEEVCQTVRFLISVRSITGQVIALDAGDHLVRHHEAG